MKWIAIYLLIGVIIQWTSESNVKKNYPELHDKVRYKLLDAIFGILFWPIVEIFALIIGIKIAIEIMNDPWAKQSDLEGEFMNRGMKWFEEHFKWYFKNEE